MAFKGINNIAARHLCEKFNLMNHQHNRNTRSSIQNNLSVPLKSNTFANWTLINSSTWTGTNCRLSLRLLTQP